MGVADDVSKAQIVERHMPENRSRAGALIEVAFAFVLTHVCYRSVKTFTPIGAWEGAARTNFTGSVVIVGFTIAVLWLADGDSERTGRRLLRVNAGAVRQHFAWSDRAWADRCPGLHPAGRQGPLEAAKKPNSQVY